MSAADDAYARLLAARQYWEGLSPAAREEYEKAEKAKSERVRIKRRMWKPF